MSGIKTLVRHSSHYLTGQACALAIGLVSFPVFTRVLSVADYGTLELIGRLALLGTAAGKLGVQHAILRYFNPRQFAEQPGAERAFYSTSLLGSLITAIVAGLATFAAFQLTSEGSSLRPLALLAGALAAVRVLYSILTNILRAEEKSHIFTAANVGARAATVASVLVLFALWRPDLRLYYGATVAVELVIVGILAFVHVRRGVVSPGGFDAGLFHTMVAFGLPMVAYETLIVALDSSDRFLIRYYLGETPLGFYAAAYTICVYIQDLLMVPINLAMVPIYLKLWNTEGPERTAEFLTDSFRLFVMAAGCLVAGVAACALSAVTLLASSKYATSASLIPWIVCGLVLYAANAFLNAPLLIHKQTRTMALLVGGALIAKVALNSLLLPALGLQGAVASTIIGYLLLLSATAYHSLRLMPIQVDPALVAKAIACAALAASAALQISIPWPAAELAARAVCVLAVYGTALSLLDSGARKVLRRGMQEARRELAGDLAG
jgi:O-antigen/teichoic acid export membrane protein